MMAAMFITSNNKHLNRLGDILVYPETMVDCLQLTQGGSMLKR